ncbi:alpha/beta fold hydrolase [Corynebacterium sp. L4756]|uniref:alpha/beta fold hydrolase n=1 Tax=unclassified Corynebacterium TaxID=2624378 RepID=UPI00374DD9EC
MSDTRLEKGARKILQKDGGVVRRPLADGREFDVAYIRTGRKKRTPVVVIPGGPGLASALPYQGFRKLAAKQGLDVIMVEHRGVGLSRADTSGELLQLADVTVEAAADDIAAVIDEYGLDQVVVAGTSYGSYLAQVFAVRHPGQVKALVLDSPMLSVEADLVMVREYRRSLLWDGESEPTAEVAAVIRQLAEKEEPTELAHVVQVVYEFAGLETLTTLLKERQAGRLGWLWKRINKMGSGEMDGEGMAYFMEPKLVRGISFAQLGYGLPADGGPLDPQLFMVKNAGDAPEFAGETTDLEAALDGYDWPTVVISGDRDLRTPRPVAEKIVQGVPRGTLVPIAETGHSMLDTHQLVLIEVLLSLLDFGDEGLAEKADYFAGRPRKGASGKIGKILSTIVRVKAKSS